MAAAGGLEEGLFEPWSSVSFYLGKEIGVAFYFQRGKSHFVDPLERFQAFVISHSALVGIGSVLGFKFGDTLTGAFEFPNGIAAVFDGFDGLVDQIVPVVD